MPFEVGKTLLQIEYRPRKRFAPAEDVKDEEKGAVAEEDTVSSGAIDSLDSPFMIAQQSRGSRPVFYRPAVDSEPVICTPAGTYDGNGFVGILPRV